MVRGPYDLSLVEGSITTPHDAERIHAVRRQSRTLITIGACATAGGIQALRNFADVREFTQAVYARPEFIETLATSTPITAHVNVDFELHGCPINKQQLLEVLAAFLNARKPNTPAHSVCVECKLRGTVCVMVRGTPCLGPVTHAGCGAICPAYNRGCYGCFGPMETPNTVAEPQAGRLRHERARPAARLQHLQRRRAAVPRGKPRAMARKTIKVDYLARVEGEGGVRITFEGSRCATSNCASSSRRASSRRSCAAAPTPKRPTSPRASAASARSPTR